jgi:hypothetical protein
MSSSAITSASTNQLFFFRCQTEQCTWIVDRFAIATRQPLNLASFLAFIVSSLIGKNPHQQSIKNTDRLE